MAIYTYIACITLNKHAILKNFLLAFCLFYGIVSKADVSLYIVGHEDDWQLFMGTNAYADLKASQNTNNLVVFFHLTAGNANIPWPQCQNYVLARERCALNSIKFGAAAGTTPLNAVSGSVSVEGSPGHFHTIAYEKYGNVLSLFFRLPDGNNSFLNFWNNQQPSISAIDGSSSYDWTDLMLTFRNLTGLFNWYNHIQFPGTNIWINSTDPNLTTNQSHGDHIASSNFGRVVSSLFCPNFVSFIDYETDGNHPQYLTNLSYIETEKEAGLFATCTLGLLEGGEQSTWDDGWHTSFLDKNYYKVDNTEGCRISEDEINAYANESLFELLPSFIQDGFKGAKKVSDNNQGVSDSKTSMNSALKLSQSQTSLFITLPENTTYKQIVIFDLWGRIMLKEQSNVPHIDISGLKSGLYFIKVQTATETILQQKFFKN